MWSELKYYTTLAEQDGGLPSRDQDKLLDGQWPTKVYLVRVITNIN